MYRQARAGSNSRDAVGQALVAVTVRHASDAAVRQALVAVTVRHRQGVVIC